jgi:hypothetical protein
MAGISSKYRPLICLGEKEFVKLVLFDNSSDGIFKNSNPTGVLS